jgi:hypothetical protein
MTPNGAVPFLIAFIVLAAAAHSPQGLAILAALALVFALIELRAGIVMALKRAAMVVLPLAAFMALVWGVIVRRSPAEIAAGLPGSEEAALAYVALVCVRLFLIVFVLNAVVLAFEGSTPLAFVRALRAPVALKRLMVLTLSLVETLRQAVDRAHTALIASGTLTRRFSLRNLRLGWVLVQTVWLTAVTVVLGRLRDKWPVENTLSRLDAALAGGDPRLIGGDDRLWLALIVGVAVVVLGAA